jgi:hypothetical protein
MGSELAKFDRTFERRVYSKAARFARMPLIDK